MSIFFTENSKILVYHKGLKQEGTLWLITRIKIKGNYLKSPVIVEIKYEANFQPDEKYWEIDTEYPDEDPYSVNYLKEFNTNEEREFYVKASFNELHSHA